MALKILNKAWPYGLIILLVIMFAAISFKSEDSDYAQVEFTDYTVPENLFIDLEKELIRKKAGYIEEEFKSLKGITGFNGTVLYGEKGRIVYKNAFGYAEHSQKISLSTDTKFQLASVSKMFTAVSVLILYERGLLDLDDSVNKFIPGFPYRGITIRNLLNHRSGLPRYMSLAHNYWNDKTRPITNDDIIDLFIRHKPKKYYAPDKVFHYCNTNYALLASVVEVVSKKSFDKFVNMNIFHPLRMKNSLVYNHKYDSTVPDYVPYGAAGYNGRWRLRKVRDNYLNGVMGDKGVYSTVEDLYKFDQALFNGTLVSNHILKQAYLPGSPERNNRDNYGFGWRIKADADSCVYHYGWWKGFRTFFIRDLKEEKTIIVLSNHSRGPGSHKLWEIIRNNENNLGFKCDLFSDELIPGLQ